MLQCRHIFLFIFLFYFVFLHFCFQEFGVERYRDLVKAYDLLIQRVVGNIVRAVDIVVGLFNGDTGINKLFDNFVEELENIPTRIRVSVS